MRKIHGAITAAATEILTHRKFVKLQYKVMCRTGCEELGENFMF